MTARDLTWWREGRSGPGELALGTATEKPSQGRVALPACPLVAWRCPLSGDPALACLEGAEEEKREKGAEKYR